jgi:hypothetical protein
MTITRTHFLVGVVALALGMGLLGRTCYRQGADRAAVAAQEVRSQAVDSAVADWRARYTAVQVSAQARADTLTRLEAEAARAVASARRAAQTVDSLVVLVPDSTLAHEITAALTEERATWSGERAALLAQVSTLRSMVVERDDLLAEANGRIAALIQDRDEWRALRRPSRMGCTVGGGGAVSLGGRAAFGVAGVCGLHVLGG